jgi:hypothetical protein
MTSVNIWRNYFYAEAESVGSLKWEVWRPWQCPFIWLFPEDYISTFWGLWPSSKGWVSRLEHEVRLGTCSGWVRHRCLPLPRTRDPLCPGPCCDPPLLLWCVHLHLLVLPLIPFWGSSSGSRLVAVQLMVVAGTLDAIWAFPMDCFSYSRQHCCAQGVQRGRTASPSQCFPPALMGGWS